MAPHTPLAVAGNDLILRLISMCFAPTDLSAAPAHWRVCCPGHVQPSRQVHVQPVKSAGQICGDEAAGGLPSVWCAAQA